MGCITAFVELCTIPRVMPSSNGSERVIAAHQVVREADLVSLDPFPSRLSIRSEFWTQTIPRLVRYLQSTHIHGKHIRLEVRKDLAIDHHANARNLVILSETIEEQIEPSNHMEHAWVHERTTNGRIEEKEACRVGRPSSVVR